MIKSLISKVADIFKKKDASSPQVQLMDPATIYFSLPTINDTLPANDPNFKSTGDHLSLHEDDWRQVEAVSLDWEQQIKKEIESVERILNQNSTSGESRAFKDIHVRKLIGHPLAVPWEDFLKTVGVEEQNTSGLSVGWEAGLVPGGFSIQIGNLTVYGLKDETLIHALCLHGCGSSGLNQAETKSFVNFLIKHDLAIVDWPAAEMVHDQRALVQFLEKKS